VLTALNISADSYCKMPGQDCSIILLVDAAQKWAMIFYFQQSFQVAFISSHTDKAYPCSLV